MNKVKTDKLLFFVLALIVSAFPFFTGGYYVFYCAAASIVLTANLFLYTVRHKSITVSLGFSSAVITLITLMYLITKLWAVDKTMSVYGFVKLLTVFLFMLNLWQTEKEEQGFLLYFVPPAAALMTLSSFLLGQIDSLHSRFFDNMGDLHGMFEYANSFALYELAAVIIALYQPKKNRLSAVLSAAEVLICGFGIYMSGARAVMLLTAGILFLAAVFSVTKRLKTKKAKAVFFSAIVAMITAAGIAAVVTGLAARLFHSVTTDSSFVERMLFWKDALRYGIQHPFGKGAYAFYYVQPQIQSAYYYAIDVHNDYIQMMVEVGILPALAFAALLAYHIFSRKTDMLKRMLLLAIALHAFVDYDLQFTAVFVIIVLCLEFDREKQLEVKGVLIPAVIAVTAIVMNVMLGLSSYYNYIGNQPKSNYYHKNTSAMLIMMQSTNQQQLGYELATDILKNNDCIFEANHVLSNIYAENGRYEEAVEQMELVLKKDPRNMEHYKDYIDLCIAAEEASRTAGDTALGKSCLEKITDVPRRLEELEQNTDEAAKLYGRKQSFSVGKKYRKKINKARADLAEHYN